ncbi:hypothetical protein BDK51DRAFT_48551 [Blyttiomyces helicus]|uniref:Mediator of RNA polymerase II transcription subunit 25 n=1 Tax=Blyttiomyces helicus TaxID=388810 RepID=A0A4V1IQX4_9FUNG|nr:hypothetical protein BDK51DRAFT_48551 [Blyttiomyces helicus]|eukprot:RKO88067.1 hypothetical protein BDK51DRAFT_48551 [Blyttiomyces helicus]
MVSLATSTATDAIFVVDGSASMAEHFPLLLRTYLEPIVVCVTVRFGDCVEITDILVILGAAESSSWRPGCQNGGVPTATSELPGKCATFPRSDWSRFLRPALPPLSPTPPCEQSLRFGLVVYGDYPPYSDRVAERHLLGADADAVLTALRKLKFQGGGVWTNAAAEGLAAAMEMYNDLRPEAPPPDAAPPVRHCFLVPCTEPHKLAVRCNLMERFDDMSLSEIGEEMGKDKVRLSLISARKDIKDFEDIVTSVNRAGMVNVSDGTPASSNHAVRLAGLSVAAFAVENGIV